MEKKKSNEVFLFSATYGNKRRNLMLNRILYYRSLPYITFINSILLEKLFAENENLFPEILGQLKEVWENEIRSEST